MFTKVILIQFLTRQEWDMALAQRELCLHFSCLKLKYQKFLFTWANLIKITPTISTFLCYNIYSYISAETVIVNYKVVFLKRLFDYFWLFLENIRIWT